ncbi:1,4-alpha-glucan branching protein GlgB [Roseivirga sp. BDSF3-8]|uniref:1,4-alpha-glucan branching protein GlgB n=1 Tax=Roseivirga sp. BDSF3-8 TaxID=3241598 RepID=UPI0035323AC4
MTAKKTTNITNDQDKDKKAEEAKPKKATTSRARKGTGAASKSGTGSAEKKTTATKATASRKTGATRKATKATEDKGGKNEAVATKTTARKGGSSKRTTKSKGQENSQNDQLFPSRFTDFDIHLFREGKHYDLYNKLGSHIVEHNGQKGVYFAVWAPNAENVWVNGNFNHWDRYSHPLFARWDGSGIWEGFIPGLGRGDVYKYVIRSRFNDYEVEKGDPFAIHWENPPQTASIVWDMEYKWKDKKWMDRRMKEHGQQNPVSVYEVHLGSWRRKPEEDNRHLSYTELAEELPAYVKEMGFTHVEFLPVMEHPFYGSWGYQITGYFAPSSRFGTPQEFMALVDALHKEGIGVILDWVPSHFPGDEHGLAYFDGTHLFEHSDPRKGYHPDWKSYIFNYGRNEVRSFLISNALYWLDKYHIDGLRVDAVASMLYLDYSRNEGEWIPNEHGGRENLESIQFLQEFNTATYGKFPDTFTVAEESTAWPNVSRPVDMGGLGFGMKWMMGWMHDTLDYFSKDPVYRRYHQGEITFSIVYAFTENFMLPLSHDEVVHGKGPLFDKMPGDDWQKFANLRALYSLMYAHPGTKLLFMGGEFGQRQEWRHEGSLDWHLTEYEPHRGVQSALKKLNDLYKTEPALYQKQFNQEGFRWIDIGDSENSVISFIRSGNDPDDDLICVANLTPTPKHNYRIGVPERGKYKEVYNSDDASFGGSNVHNQDKVDTYPVPTHHQAHSIVLTLPPLGVIFLKRDKK